MGEKMISKKTINITNIIIYIILITVYELLYCNVSFIVGETDYNLSVFRLIVYILLFFFIIKFIFEHTKQEKDKGKFYVVLIGMVFLVIIETILLFENINKSSIKIYSCLVLSTIIIGLNILYISKDRIKNFIIIGLSIGFIFSITIPFNNQLDEKRHFTSAYNLALRKF